MVKTISLIIIHFLSISYGFTSLQSFTRLQSHSKLQREKPLYSTQLPKSPEELIATPEIWQPVKNNLNTVPTFACTNEQGQPLQYNIGDKTLAFFYTDINAAQFELQKAQEESALFGTKLMLTPFPMGEVFEMGVQQKALLIPSQTSMEAAGAPSGLSPVGQQVPLFGCMSMVETQEDGTTMVPLFCDKNEAEEALSLALQGMGEEEQSKFSLDVLPLAAAIQLQANSLGKRSFTYVAPKSSLDYLISLEQAQ